MSANILLVECEQRSVDHVRQALAETSHRLEVAGDLDRVVEICAHFEPRLVIVSSDLPGVRVEDGITQMRARAGLRVTPFLILMSDYGGADSEADAAALGAQDILGRPFDISALVDRVERLLSVDAGARATQAIPQETLEALRRTGDGGAASSLTSDELFGDIVSDVESDVRRVEPPAEEVAAPPPAEEVGPRPPRPPKPAPPSPEVEKELDQRLASVLEEGEPAPAKRRPADVERDVDAMLSETLAGLDIQLPGAKAPPPPAPEPEEAKRAEPIEEPQPAEPTGTRFGQYILEEHVATGGMAEVYRARMMGVEGFQKTVAIKRILPQLADNEELVTMFIDEAKLAAQLSHNNIIHIYDLGKIEGSFYIAMEYIEGRDLRSLLQECRDGGVRVPIPLALHIGALLASALDHAHSKRDFEDRDLGLVHRDVSPQNVLISVDGDVKLCDFGIAKAASKASETHAGALKGKLQYMSPEQASGGEIDHRSDLFSLGLVLHEMLTGEQVFTGSTETAILEQVRDPKVTAPSAINGEISEEVDRIVLKALEPDPDMRYQSAGALQSDLEEVIRAAGWMPDGAALAAFVADPAVAPEIMVAVPEEPEFVELFPPEPVEPVKPPEPVEPVKPPEPSEEEVEELGAVPFEEVAEPLEPYVEEPTEERKKPVFLYLGIAVLAVMVGVMVVILRGGGGEMPVTSTPVPLIEVPRLPAPTETPTPTPEAAVAQPVVPTRTPTPELPTETPTETVTPTPEVTDTPTPLPPTVTPVPPTPTPRPPTPTFTPSVREGDLVPAGPDVTKPIAVHQVTPEFPPVAQRMRVSGSVEAAVLVGPDGSVEDIRIVSVSRTGVGFERATEDAIRQWRYKPATKNGVKVRTWVTVRVPFRYR